MRKIEIKEFGILRDVTYELDQSFNLIIGKQATGKSTMMKLVYFFESIKDEYISLLIELQSDETIDSELLLLLLNDRIENKFFSIYNSILDTSKNISVKYFYDDNKYIEITPDHVFQNCLLIIRYSENFQNEMNDSLKFHKIYVNNNKNILDDVLLSMNKNERYIKKCKEIANQLFCSDFEMCLFIPAGRYWATQLKTHEENSADYLIKRFNSYTDIIKRNYNYGIVKLIEKDLHLTAIEKERLQLLSKQILKGDYVFNSNFESIRFGSKENDYVRLSQASSGQQEVLWILLSIIDMIIRYRKMLIIIEEPEAHIFPDGQKDIVELILLLVKTTNSKVFITTHSPYILSAANLFLYRENKDKDKIEDVSAFLFSYENEFKINNILDEDTGIILSEYIDEVSKVIDNEFDALLAEEGNAYEV